MLASAMGSTVALHLSIIPQLGITLAGFLLDLACLPDALGNSSPQTGYRSHLKVVSFLSRASLASDLTWSSGC